MTDTAKAQSATPSETAKEILTKNIEMNHNLVMVIGFNKNGKIHIDTNRPTYEFVNYAVNRAMYNINHLETSDVLRREQEAEQTVRNLVEQLPAEVPKKKGPGRPRKGTI